jgi:hypothetical protein
MKPVSEEGSRGTGIQENQGVLDSRRSLPREGGGGSDDLKPFEGEDGLEVPGEMQLAEGPGEGQLKKHISLLMKR